MHKQASATSCGIAAALQVAAKHHPAVAKYAELTPHEAAAEQARVHRLASRITLPWPRMFGTSPWALAKLLGTATGLKYRSHVWSTSAQEKTLRALEAGHDVAFYTGGGTLKQASLQSLDLIPRHVITASMRGGKLQIFEPSVGRIWTMSWSDFLKRSNTLEKEPAFGYWKRVLLAVVPE
ncbi:MAG: hypothetical protein Q4E01_04090 [Actinomycetaceae bacterium]|nr:hypothetical protein [Actinomycetaceae bacterium]